MLDIKVIREDPEKLRQNLHDRQMKDRVGEVDRLLKLDTDRCELIQQIEKLRAQQNKLDEKIKVSKDKALIKEATQLKQQIQQLRPELTQAEEKYTTLLEQMPNWLHPDVPVGVDESENKMIRRWGNPTEFDFKPKDHVDLGTTLDLIDIETAARVSGARFYYLKNDAVLIQFALINLVLDRLTRREVVAKIAQSVNNPFDAPFIPIVPPVLMRPDVMRKMGRLEPVEDRYLLEKDDLVLVGSAEHTLGPIHMDEIIPEQQLPVRYLGYSTAFRQEAGAYGRDTRGILRVHQFDKLEMESFIQPEYSVVEQDLMVGIQEYLMQQLNIPYQIVAICTGDMGAPDYRQIDLEAWLPGQGQYRETHTADLMTDFQSRRLNIKFKGTKGRKDYVHMNDATTFAIGRTLIAILENYQQADGTVMIPEVLQEYVGKDLIEARS